MKGHYWINNAEDYHNTLKAEREVLLPFIADIVDSFNAKKILDFGCGNGYLSSLFKTKSEISLYDISSNHFQAKRNWDINNNVIICESQSDLKNEYYDVVVQSSVLMCLPTISDLRKVFVSNYNTLKAGGHLVVSITHPCFLQYDYGHYSTSFNDDNFDYTKNCSEYKVFMNRKDNDAIIFTDYQWSLSTIINELIVTGFEIEEMIEHKDMDSTEFEAKQEGCPWMFLILKK